MSPTVNRRSAEHLELIFEIYSLIPTTRKITAREIQQALSDKGVIRTKRTVQRYLDSLLNYFDIEQDTRSQPYPVTTYSNETNSMVFETLCTAVFYQREVRLSLINLPKSLYVNPLGFIVEQGHFYLAYQYQATFHVVLIDEVVSAYLTTFAYHYPNNFSLSNTPLSKKELTP